MSRTSVVLAVLLAGLSGTVSAQNLAARVDSQITDIQGPATAAPNHSPRFYIDEPGAILGALSLAALAVDFLQANQ